MSEVMEKSVAERVQEALQTELSSADIAELQAEIKHARHNLAVKAFELAQVPDTDGTPADIAARRMDAATAKAAEDQLSALARQLDARLERARRREGFANREKLTAALVKAVQRARKATESCNAAWQDADAALEALQGARSNAMGRVQLPWDTPSDGRALAAIRDALEVCEQEWRFEHDWDEHPSQKMENYAREIG